MSRIYATIFLFAAAIPAGASAQAKPEQAGPPSATHAITQAAVHAGVLSCAGRVNQVATFLTNERKAGVFMFTPSTQQDQRVFSASLELTDKQDFTSYASATFAPNQANGCGALYETVSYEPLRCDVVAAKQYPGKKVSGKLGVQTAILELGPTARVFLMPASQSGCVVIKKEVIS